MARIALVCEPPDGGAAEHVAQLARGLPEHGHEAVVFAPAAFAPALDGVRALPFRRDYAHPQDDARTYAELVRALRGFDLVHAHAAKAGVLARLAGWSARRPVVYTPHSFPFVGEMGAARRVFSHVVERLLAPPTAAIIAVCEFERDLARANRVCPRILAVVHNGSPSCPRPAMGGGLVVGTVAAMRRQKRLDVMLAAAPRILAAVPEATVKIVGDGPEGPALRAAADPRVVFEPFRAPAVRQLSELDVYVLPSGWEAFPIGVLEALACGVPQVATDVGGTREAVVPETGLLISPGDPGALADAVIELLRDPQRRARMATASRERHAAHFTVDRMVAGTAAVYDRVLSR